MKLHTLLLVSALACAYAADAPYVGTWKANTAKSNLAGSTITYEKLPSGEWQATADGVTYKFKMDGNGYPDNFGDMVAWKSIDSTTWQTAWKTNGKLVSTDTVRVGADGLLTISTKGTKPNGAPIDDTTILQRVSGGPGLAGKWKTKTFQSNNPDVMQISAAGADGLNFKNSFGVECVAKTDGKDYPCRGPLTAEGWTLVWTKSGATGLAATIKKDGKPLYHYTYSVSPNGKTLTSVGGAVATRETTKMVWDRQ